MQSFFPTFGYSTGVLFPKETQIPIVLKELAKHETNLVEINVATLDDLQYLTPATVALANLFKKKTVHAPFLGIRYSKDTTDVLKKLYQFAKSINAEYVVFHPDIVDDFEHVFDIMQNYTAFENMDVRKNFGNTVQDLQTIFKKCPKAKWICDLNHVYTVDPSMKLAEDMHAEFGDRLAGYHISGYSDSKILHTCFFITHEDQILNSIEKKDVCIIHEGGGQDHEDFILKENQYLYNYYTNKYGT